MSTETWLHQQANFRLIRIFYCWQSWWRLACDWVDGWALLESATVCFVCNKKKFSRNFLSSGSKYSPSWRANWFGQLGLPLLFTHNLVFDSKILRLAIFCRSRWKIRLHLKPRKLIFSIYRPRAFFITRITTIIIIVNHHLLFEVTILSCVLKSELRKKLPRRVTSIN